MKSPTRNIVWFRRDLRISDHPALNAALESSDEIVPVFILDKKQIAEAGSKLLPHIAKQGAIGLAQLDKFDMIETKSEYIEVTFSNGKTIGIHEDTAKSIFEL
mgnify:CR=1 FL=1